MKKKHLCRLINENILNDDIKKYMKKVKKPKFICTNCGRAANNEDRLCKPVKI
jgi:hypothetical protein